MQIFLLSKRSTASGNGIGSAPTTVRYKTSPSRGEEPLHGARPSGAVTAEDVGAVAVHLARSAVARAVGAKDGSEPEREPTGIFRERRGVFVTWCTFPDRDLRGCIGFPQPVLPLAEGLREAAVAAALEDPRFPPVTAGELHRLVADVSLLTPFVPLPLPARPDGVRVGRDGLSVERGRLRGLLLPQVAVEQGWDAEELLDGTCEKAGLARGAWRSEAVAVYRFEAEVYRELEPAGRVERARSPA